MAEDESSDGEKVNGAGSTPTHTGSAKAGLVLFGGAFDHATANSPFLLTHLEIVHTVLIVLEVGRFTVQVFGEFGVCGCGLREFDGDTVGMSLVEGGGSGLEPMLGGWGSISFDQTCD